MNNINNTAQAARRERLQAAKKFLVRSLTKSGSISKSAPTAIQLQLNAFASEQQAVARLAALEVLNPTRRFTIVSL
jgi:hypothetical protein